MLFAAANPPQAGRFPGCCRAITAGQLRAILGEQSFRKRQGELIQLGALLLQTALVSPETLAQALVQQTLAWVPAHHQRAE